MPRPFFKRLPDPEPLYSAWNPSERIFGWSIVSCCLSVSRYQYPFVDQAQYTAPSPLNSGSIMLCTH